MYLNLASDDDYSTNDKAEGVKLASRKMAKALSMLMGDAHFSSKDPSFEDVVNVACTGFTKRICIVVHVDEYQNAPNQAAALVRVCRESTTNNLVFPLVFTGTTSASTINLLIRPSISNTIPHPFTLSYFEPGSKIAKDLIQATINCVGKPKTYRVDWAQEPKIFHRLIHDTSGWPFALVQLAGALAIYYVPRRTEEQLRLAEEQYTSVVKEVYKTDVEVYIEKGIVKPLKLLRVALSPFSVKRQ